MSIRVLYIEDDQVSREVMKQMLASVGAVMSEAPDARTGLRMIDQDDFDVVLMDLRMPEISGLTAIRHVRARVDQKRHLPILVISAELTNGAREMCRSAGAQELVAKPVTMEQLFRAIGEALAGAERATIN